MNKFFTVAATMFFFFFASPASAETSDKQEFVYACIGDVWVANYKGAEWVLLNGNKFVSCSANPSTAPYLEPEPGAENKTIVKMGQTAGIRSGVPNWTWIRVPKKE